MPSFPARSRIGVLLTLAIIAYLPALHLPFIADDYTQIPLARHFADQGWLPLFHEINLRSRATYMIMSAILDRTFGFNPVAFYAASLILHALCVLLVYATAVWTELGEPVAFWSAAFFAVQEGHQEAVMWPAAGGDLLVFLFGMAAWVCWVKWLQGGHWKWYACAIASFVLAAFSKESVWVFAPLMLIPVAFSRSRRQASRRGEERRHFPSRCDGNRPEHAHRKALLHHHGHHRRLVLDHSAEWPLRDPHAVCGLCGGIAGGGTERREPRRDGEF